MYICFCKNLSEKQIQDLIDKGMSYEEIKAYTLAGSHCGQCKEDIVEMLKKGSKDVPSKVRC